MSVKRFRVVLSLVLGKTAEINNAPLWITYTIEASEERIDGREIALFFYSSMPRSLQRQRL